MCVCEINLRPDEQNSRCRGNRLQPQPQPQHPHFLPVDAVVSLLLLPPHLLPPPSSSPLLPLPPSPGGFYERPDTEQTFADWLNSRFSQWEKLLKARNIDLFLFIYILPSQEFLGNTFCTQELIVHSMRPEGERGVFTHEWQEKRVMEGDGDDRG